MSIAWNTKISVSLRKSPPKFLQCEELWGEIKHSNQLEYKTDNGYEILKFHDTEYLRILSYDINTNSLKFQPVLALMRKKLDPGVLLRLSISDKYYLDVTRDQPIFDFDKKINPDKAETILFANESQNILMFSNPPREKTESYVLSRIKIKDIQIINYIDNIYSFDVWNSKNYVANGLLVTS